MKYTKLLLALLFAIGLSFGVDVSASLADEFISHAPATARTYIAAPANGETVPETFTVQFGLSGMGVAPAGVEKENTGHHHLLIDVRDLPDLTVSLPKSEQVRHFGGGQTETELTLSPGVHTLQLVLGNHLHIPHDNPVISEPITVVVQGA